ncbi:MAG: hypothetical protein ACREIT_03505 [Tepidisphaeraceae bacterium]
MFEILLDKISVGAVLILSAGVALFVGGRVCGDVLAGGGRGPKPGRRAVGLWLPIAMTAVGAMVGGRSEVALGIAFATSVASLSLVVGLICLYQPIGRDVERHGIVPGLRAWPFVLPAALLALLAGFSGELNTFHALVLLGQGLAALLVWGDERETVQIHDASPTPEPTRTRWVLLVLALLVAALGAWAGLRGIALPPGRLRMFSPAVLSATVLSPLLLLPMMNVGLGLTRQGRAAEALTTQVGVVLLNLCLLLPVLVGIACVKPLFAGAVSFLAPSTLNAVATTLPATAPATQPEPSPIDDAYVTAELRAPRALPYPLITWRVDTVVLIVLGFMLVPMALGRLTLGQAEGAGLLAGYCAYLVLVTALGLKW